MDEMRQRKEKLSSEMKQIKIEAKENAAWKDEFLEFSKQSQIFLEEMTVYLKGSKDSKRVENLIDEQKQLNKTIKKQLADIENELEFKRKKLLLEKEELDRLHHKKEDLNEHWYVSWRFW